MGIAKEFKVTGTRRDVLCFRGEKSFTVQDPYGIGSKESPTED